MNTNRVWMHRYFPILVAFVLGTALGYLIAYVSGVQPSFVPLVSAVLGLVVAFSVPLWQALFVNAPKLSVEISAIDRILSDEPLVPDPIDTPELKLLRMLAQELFRYQRFFPDFLDNTSVQGEKRKHTLKDLEQLLSTAQQRHEDLPKVIEDRKQELEKVNQLTESTFTRNERNRLLNQLNASAFSLNESVQLAQLFNEPDKPLDEFKEIYKQQLEEAEKLYNDLQRDLPTAERKLEQLRKDLYNN